MRFELTTLTLARLCSTPELRPLVLSLTIISFTLQRSAAGDKYIEYLQNTKTQIEKSTNLQSIS